ncbi:MAG: hydrogenase maturation nickel metallochaperone HypA [Chloroflexi bacterium]|nr:hydrogenase maturation nickel metallochaperone HypA [Chloroflexota bacterium]
MHELAVTEQVLQISLDHAERASARRVVAIYLIIGELSSILDDSVQFYWDIISAGTAAQGAHLHFRRAPACFACAVCGSQSEGASWLFECPACGSSQVKLLAGDEFHVEALDVETCPSEVQT